MLIMQAQDDMPSSALAEDRWCEYEVTIHTADMQGAGTDADVSLVMFGTSGNHDGDHGVMPTSMYCSSVSFIIYRENTVLPMYSTSYGYCCT